MQCVPYKKIEDFCAAAFAAKGVPEASARSLAEIITLTEAFGITTHGLKVLTAVHRKIGKGIDPAGEPEIVADGAASAVIDGSRTFGQLAMKLAKRTAVDKARRCGVAMVAVRNTSWLGAVGPYLIDIAQDGLLAMVTAQSSSCKDCAPVGGIDATFSTNPIALAFPTGGEPVIADFSTAAYSMGKIGQLRRAGKKAPEEVFLDKDGKLSDDPGVVNDAGSVLFAGGRNFGHKGYALSLWCEALTAISGGSANNPDVPGRQSFTLTVIDPDAFAGSDYYLTEMKRFLARVKASRPRPGAEAIRLPGERGFAALADAKENGIHLDDAFVEQLNRIAEENGLEPIA